MSRKVFTRKLLSSALFFVCLMAVVSISGVSASAPTQNSIGYNNTIYALNTRMFSTWNTGTALNGYGVYTNITGQWLQYNPTYTLAVDGGIPDINTFTENDVNNRFTLNNSYCVYNGLRRDDNAHYNNYTISESGDIYYPFSWRVTSQDYGDGSQSFYAGLIAVAQNQGDYYDMATNAIKLMTYQTGANSNTEYLLYMNVKIGGGNSGDVSSNTYDVGTTYYGIMKRTSGVITIEIYSDSGFSSSIETLTVGGTTSATYTVLEVGFSVDSAINPASNSGGWIKKETYGTETHTLDVIFPPYYTHAGKKVGFYFTASNNDGSTQSTTEYIQFLPFELYKEYIDATNFTNVVLEIDNHNDYMFISESTGIYHVFGVDLDTGVYTPYNVFSTNGVEWEIDNIQQMDATSYTVYHSFEMWYDEENGVTYFDHIGVSGTSILYARYIENQNGTLSRLQSYQTVKTLGDIRNLDLEINDEGYAIIKYNKYETPVTNGGHLGIIVNSKINGLWNDYSYYTYDDVLGVQENGRIKVVEDKIFYIGSYRHNSTSSVKDYMYTMHSNNKGSTWSNWKQTQIKDTGIQYRAQPKMRKHGNNIYIFETENDSPYAKNIWRVNTNTWKINYVVEVDSAGAVEQDWFITYDKYYERFLIGYEPNTYVWFKTNTETLTAPITGEMWVPTMGNNEGGTSLKEFGSWSINPYQMVTDMKSNYSVPLASYIGQTFSFYQLNPTGAELQDFVEWIQLDGIRNNKRTEYGRILIPHERHLLQAKVQNNVTSFWFIIEDYNNEALFYYNNTNRRLTITTTSKRGQPTSTIVTPINVYRTKVTADNAIINVLFETTEDSFDYYNVLLKYGYSIPVFGEYNKTSTIKYSILTEGGIARYDGNGTIYQNNDQFSIGADGDGNYERFRVLYRNLEHMHFQVELDTSGDWNALTGLFENVTGGYYEYGMNYWFNKTYREGWKVRIYPSSVAVGHQNAGVDLDYVQWTIEHSFYNDTSDSYQILQTDILYSNFNGYDNEDATPSYHNQTSSRYWVDLWFSNENASRKVATRINSEYYGMYEQGSSWWLGYGEFRPVIGELTDSMFFDNVYETSGNNTVGSTINNVDAVEFWGKVAKVTGGNNHEYKMYNYYMKNKEYAIDDFDGIDTPVLVETKVLDMPNTGFLTPLVRVIESIREMIINALTYFMGLLAGFVDNLLVSLGLPPLMSIFYNLLVSIYDIFVLLYSELSNIISWMITSITNTIDMFFQVIPKYLYFVGMLVNGFVTWYVNIVNLFTGGIGNMGNFWTEYNVYEIVEMWILVILPFAEVARIESSKEPMQTLVNDVKMLIDVVSAVFKITSIFLQVLLDIIKTIVGVF